MAAVNLRDVGEVDPTRLRRGVLFRCSQIYTNQVLKDLGVRTVVDLRGRAERGASPKTAQSIGTGSSTAAPAPPQLLSGAQLQALSEPGGGDSSNGNGDSSDFTVTPFSGVTSAASAGGGQVSEGGRTMPALDQGAQDGSWDVLPTREAFNIIPAREFGLAMLRMPWRVWRDAFAGLARGRDPRSPFVEAFADEQLLGFTRYYIIILEASKKNVAAVLRVFTKPQALPALIHCAHGKDRTGVIVLLLLLICEVPGEAIVADYAQSEVELRRYRQSLGLQDPTGATGAVIPLSEIIIASTQKTLRAVLAYIHATYSTVGEYLASCGITQQEIDAIRANLMLPEAFTSLPNDRVQK